MRPCGCCDFSDSSAACIHQIPTTSTCQQTKLRSGKEHTGWRAGTFSSTLLSTVRKPSERPVAGVCKRSPEWATVEPGCCVDALPPVSCSRLTTHSHTLIRGYHQAHHPMRLHRHLVRSAPTECIRGKRTTRHNCRKAVTCGHRCLLKEMFLMDE